MPRTLGCDVQVLPGCDALFIHPIPPSDLIPKSLQGLHPMLWRDPRSQPKKKIPGRTNNPGASLPSSFWFPTFNCYFWCFLVDSLEIRLWRSTSMLSNQFDRNPDARSDQFGVRFFNPRVQWSRSSSEEVSKHIGNSKSLSLPLDLMLESRNLI